MDPARMFEGELDRKPGIRERPRPGADLLAQRRLLVLKIALDLDEQRSADEEALIA